MDENDHSNEKKPLLHETSPKSIEPKIQNNEIPKQSSCFWKFITTVIPCILWLKDYKLRYLQKDLLAGLTVAVIVLPQGLAYAGLASLPPVYGLYASLWPPLIYLYFGTSGQMHIGPFALISMMVSSICTPIVSPDLPEFIDVALNLSLVCGVILLIWGICRLGVITSLLSDPILNAFTTASAFNISSSQFKYLFGLSEYMKKRGPFFYQLYQLAKAVIHTNLAAFTISAVSFVTIIVVKRLNKRYCKKIPIPVELLVVILVTGLSAAFNFNKLWDVEILKTIPKGLPRHAIPKLTYTTQLIIPGLTLSLIIYAVGISIGKTFSRQFGYRIDPNQELIAHGFANIVGSMTSSYPAAGSLSRSAIAASIGAVTPLHNLFSVVIILFALLYFTTLLYSLPQAVLGAVVVAAFEKIILQLGDTITLYRQTRVECFEWIFCFCMTCALDTQIGLYSGLGLSFVFVIGQLIYYCGIKKFCSELRNIISLDIKTEAISELRVVTVTFKSSLYYINKEILLNKILKSLPNTPTLTKYVLDFSEVKFIDNSAMLMIEDLTKLFKTKQITLIKKQASGLINNQFLLYKVEFSPEDELGTVSSVSDGDVVMNEKSSLLMMR